MKVKNNYLLVLRFLSFMLVLVSILLWLSNVLTVTEIHSSTGRNQVFQELNAEFDDSIDILVIGDSTALNSIIPAKLWSDISVTSYAVGYGFANSSEIYFDLKKIFSKQSPRFVFLEASFLVGETENTTEDPYCVQTVKSKVDYLDSQILGGVNSVFPVLKYKSSFKDMGLKDLLQIHPSSLNNIYKGYSVKKEVVPYKGNKEVEKNIFYLENSDLYVKKMASLCDENGSRLVLVMFPQISYWSEEKHNLIDRLSKENDITFIDYNINTNDYIKDFSWDTDTADGGTHLNYSGATKVTAAFENTLMDELQFQKSNYSREVIDKWDKDSADFFMAVEAQ